MSAVRILTALIFIPLWTLMTYERSKIAYDVGTEGPPTSPEAGLALEILGGVVIIGLFFLIEIFLLYGNIKWYFYAKAAIHTIKK